MRNRSVPSDTLLPHIAYPDVAAAIEWLTRVFGFREHYRYGDPAAPSGAQMFFGPAVFMIESSRPGRMSASEAGHWTQSLTLFVEDVDSIYERVQATGATIGEEIQDTIYGERQFGVLDLGGHSWLISQHIQDVDPTEWGAQMASGDAGSFPGF